jgi:hypothetical protein
MTAARVSPTTAPWAAWFGFGLACGFWAWCVLTGANDMSDPATALARYPPALGIGFGVAVLLALGLRLTRATRLLPAFAVASLACYAAVFKVVAGDTALVAAVVLVAVALWFSLRARLSIGGPLLVTLHAQGTLGGLYLAVRLQDQLAGWPGFLEAMRALAALVP